MAIRLYDFSAVDRFAILESETTARGRIHCGPTANGDGLAVTFDPDAYTLCPKPALPVDESPTRSLIILWLPLVSIEPGLLQRSQREVSQSSWGDEGAVGHSGVTGPVELMLELYSVTGSCGFAMEALDANGVVFRIPLGDAGVAGIAPTEHRGPMILCANIKCAVPASIPTESRVSRGVRWPIQFSRLYVSLRATTPLHIELKCLSIRGDVRLVAPGIAHPSP